MFSPWIYLVFALIPAFIWLAFYLRKDSHPEPNWMIVKVFLFGAVAVLPTIVIQMGFQQTVGQYLIIFALLSVASEELMKYVAARVGSFSSPELDEPVDVMLYLIIAGLGFATLENLIYLISPEHIHLFQIAGIAVARFISATFIHALSSGLLGYFIARKFFTHNKRFSGKGFLAAFSLHGLYNLSIIITQQQAAQPVWWHLAIILGVIPLGLVILNFFGFKKLKQINKQKYHDFKTKS